MHHYTKFGVASLQKKYIIIKGTMAYFVYEKANSII